MGEYCVEIVHTLILTVGRLGAIRVPYTVPIITPSRPYMALLCTPAAIRRAITRPPDGTALSGAVAFRARFLFGRGCFLARSLFRKVNFISWLF